MHQLARQADVAAARGELAASAQARQRGRRRARHRQQVYGAVGTDELEEGVRPLGELLLCGRVSAGRVVRARRYLPWLPPLATA